MKPTSYIFKSISGLILIVMVYMHLCSALCATGTGGFCGKADVDNGKKSCCSHEKKSGSKEHGCQDMHFAFFNATGKFSQAKAEISVKPFQTFIAVVNPSFCIQPVEQSKTVFAFNVFHPPPLQGDIRILIKSFLI